MWEYTVKDRCLNAINPPRCRISLALSLTINDVANKDGAEPLGLDVFPQYDTLLSAGVFSNVSIITFNSYYKNFIPPEYAVYTLSENLGKKDEEGLFKAKCSFLDSGVAIRKTREIANKLLPFHDDFALEIMKLSGVKNYNFIKKI